MMTRALRIAAHTIVVLVLGFAREAHSVQVIADNGHLARNLAAELTSRSLPARVVTLEEIAADKPTTSGELLVAAHVGRVRSTLLKAIVRRLEAGGMVLVLGEPPFEQVTFPVGEQWLPSDEYRALAPSREFLSPWQIAGKSIVSSDKGPRAGMLKVTATRLPGTTEPQTVLRADVANLTNWCTFNTALAEQLPGQAATVFWARGTTDTRQLALEFEEMDRSRWIANIDLAPEWRFYALTPMDYKFWFDSKSVGRGAPGDTLNLSNAKVFSFGLAMTHTRLKAGAHQFEIGPIGLAAIDMLRETGPVIPEIDGLSPKWMLYPIRPKTAQLHEAFRAEVYGEPELPDQAWSGYWRPMGSGFQKKRSRRFIPVVTVLNNEGTRAGTLAAITHSMAAPYPNAIYGYVSLTDDRLLQSPAWSDVIGAMAWRMENRAILNEGGADEFTYDVRDIPSSGILLGTSTGPMDLPGSTCSLRLALLKDSTVIHESYAEVQPRTESTLKTSYVPDPRATSATLRVRAELRAGDRLVDVLEHEIGFDGPRKPSEFMRTADGQFQHRGKPWRAFGVNYMPTSGCAHPEPEEFEFYLDDRAYDPEIIEADLQRIEALGMNMISVFIYAECRESGNLLDLLRRARNHGLKVNLSLRPNLPPFPASDNVMTTLIKTFRTSEKDEIMAYDIAWEPWWGEFRRRCVHGPKWAEWVTGKYGSIEAAERAWQFRLEGHDKRKALETFPADEQLRCDGAWTAAVADYHRFVDEYLGAAYRHARETVHRLDPNHLISFRQSEGANPTVDQAMYPIGLQVVADAVDFFSPEAYGVGEEETKTRTMLFARAYGQSLAPGKPMLWAEYGFSVWNGSSFDVQPEMLQQQAEVYARVLKYVQESRSAGAVAWWLAGGFRKGENSDYGIVNPDGTARPVGAVLREFGPIIKAQPPTVRWKTELTAKRESSVKGYQGVYDQLDKRFWESVTDDTIPVVKIER